MRAQEFLIESDLEDYRQECLVAIKSNSNLIAQLAKEVVGAKTVEIRAIGSVVDRSKFSEQSDIDLGVFVRRPNGEQGTELSEPLSYKLQDVMINYPIHPCGVLNTLVFI